MAELKQGDTVQLISGGPKMSVMSVNTRLTVSQVECQWFAGNKLEHGAFPIASLKLLKEDEPKM